MGIPSLRKITESNIIRFLFCKELMRNMYDSNFRLVAEEQ